MQVDVIASVAEARTDDLLHKTIIVVDALRATSVMVTALAHGARAIVPVETVQQARQCQEAGDLLGGERFCKRINGFDLGNSPLEYTPERVKGRRLILTTTNGTRAVHKTGKAAHVLAGAFLNATACVEAALQYKRDIVMVCAGTQDVFSLEDGLCAGLLTERILSAAGEAPELSDMAQAMFAAYRDARPALTDAVLACANGRKMIRLGCQDDVDYCTRIDFHPVVPILKDNVLVAGMTVSAGIKF